MSLLAKLLLGDPGVENRRTCRLVGKWSYALLQRKEKDVASVQAKRQKPASQPRR